MSVYVAVSNGDGADGQAAVYSVLDEPCVRVEVDDALASSGLEHCRWTMT